MSGSSQVAIAPPRADAARGVFETVLVLDGRAVGWRRHRERLAASARELYGAALEPALDRRVERLAAGRALGRLRVVATPLTAGSVAIDLESGALACDVVLPRAEPSLAPARVRAGFGAHKLVDRAWLERIEASVPRGTRALLVGGQATVLETTRANVFALRGGALTTPPLDGSILPGVMRAVLIERAHELGLEVSEAPLALAALAEADAILLTGSLRLLESRLERGGRGAEATIGALRAAVARWAGRAACDRALVGRE